MTNGATNCILFIFILAWRLLYIIADTMYKANPAERQARKASGRIQ